MADRFTDNFFGFGMQPPVQQSPNLMQYLQARQLEEQQRMTHSPPRWLEERQPGMTVPVASSEAIDRLRSLASGISDVPGAIWEDFKQNPPAYSMVGSIMDMGQQAGDAYRRGDYANAALLELAAMSSGAVDLATLGAAAPLRRVATTGIKAIEKAAKKPMLGEVSSREGTRVQGKGTAPVGESPAALGTGTSDIANDIPVSWRGRPLNQMTPQDFAEFGKHYGVPNLGPATKPQTYKYKTGGGSFNIPGGVKGKFTYYDLLQMKSDGINANRIDPNLHAQIQTKLSRTMQPENMTDEHVFNSMLFGMTSPSQPLFPNQAAVSRLRVRNSGDIDRLANMVPWDAGDRTISKEIRDKYDEQIARFFGTQAEHKGGLGIKGTANYTRIAELAKMFKEDPSWFRRGTEEPWDEFVERLSTQVDGLGTKTAALSVVWQDPLYAAISAIDRHMAKGFYDETFKSGKKRRAFERKVADRWNENVNKRRALDRKLKAGEVDKDAYEKIVVNLPGTAARRVRGFGGIIVQPGGDGFFTEQILGLMTAKPVKYRNVKGEISKTIPEHLQNTRWLRDPEKIQKVPDMYRQALAVNKREAAKHGMNLFSSQWMHWDRIRQRLEPHENMFPGLEKLPTLSKEQLKGVLSQMTASGHRNYAKVPVQTTRGTLSGLNPTKPFDPPAAAAYFSALLAAGAGAGAATTGLTTNREPPEAY